jgi:hypothetical protein
MALALDLIPEPRRTKSLKKRVQQPIRQARYEPNEGYHVLRQAFGALTFHYSQGPLLETDG